AGSALVRRAGEGGAAGDRAPFERRSVLRAHATGDALCHVVARVRAAALERQLHGTADGAMHAAALVAVEITRRTGRIDPSPPEDFLDEQVAEPRDTGLGHQHGPHPRPATGQYPVELGLRHLERVGTQAVLVGIELDRTEATRVAHGEPPAVGEPHREAVPLRVLEVAAVYEWVAGGFAVDQHTAAHAQVQSERGAAP